MLRVAGKTTFLQKEKRVHQNGDIGFGLYVAWGGGGRGWELPYERGGDARRLA